MHPSQKFGEKPSIDIGDIAETYSSLERTDWRTHEQRRATVQNSGAYTF